MENYGEAQYWDKRYQESGKDVTYEWIRGYESIKEHLMQYLTSTDMKILILGCGNSEFSENLYDDGFQNLVNVDISSVCID